MKRIFPFLFATCPDAQCWQEVSGGDDFPVAIKKDGTLWAWEKNNDGQLGDGSSSSRNIDLQNYFPEKTYLITKF